MCIRDRLIPISIHAPCTGSDDGLNPHGAVFDISIHAPRTGSDRISQEFFSISDTFQSTLPARGATGSCIELFDAREISIHAPRTGSDDAHRLHRLLDGISIHAPRTGSDQPSCRPRRSWHSISIHAPRTGSDKWTAFMSPPRGYFNPRSPHGERPSRYPQWRAG